MPGDPAEILALATEANDLDRPGAQPWHLKASYQTFDSEGNPENSGTFEEFWVSVAKYKTSYTSANFTQTDFATDHGLYRSGNQTWPGPAEMTVRLDLTQPIPLGMNFHEVALEKGERFFGQLQLRCITLKPKEFNPNIAVIRYSDPNHPHYCFDWDQPILRFFNRGDGTYDTTFNNEILFQGRHLFRNIEIDNQGKRRIAIRIETLTSLSAVNEADFTPPSDAIGPLDGKITVSSAAMQSLLLKRLPIEYPDSAWRTGVQGEVVVQTTIAKDGHVTAAAAISGPSLLQKTAVDSVRKWLFRPFLIMGEPVEVESALEITFVLPRSGVPCLRSPRAAPRLGCGS